MFNHFQNDPTHITDYNAWHDNKLTRCDCGMQHDHKTFLNANSGNWLCRDCVQAKDQAERKRKQREREQLQAEVDRFSIFRKYNSQREMLNTLDTVYGKGNYETAGRNLTVIRSDGRKWYTSYRIVRYDTGRCAIYDREKV